MGATLTCQCPLSRAMCVTTVEDHVSVVARPVCRAELQEGFDLGLQSLHGHPARWIVAAVIFNHVVGEEALHVVQHARGALVQLVHLTRGQQHGLTVGTTGRREEEQEDGDDITDDHTKPILDKLGLPLLHVPDLFFSTPIFQINPWWRFRIRYTKDS